MFTGGISRCHQSSKMPVLLRLQHGPLKLPQYCRMSVTHSYGSSCVEFILPVTYGCCVWWGWADVTDREDKQS